MAAIALALLSACVATRREGDRALYPGDERGRLLVYVTYNGFHSDLNVPSAFLRAGSGPSAMAASGLAPRRWIALGWGDAAFYQGRGFGPARAMSLLRSAFWPFNASVVHLGSDDDPLRPAPGWRALRLSLSARGAEALRRRLDASFALADGRPAPAAPPSSDDLAPGALSEGAFFRSRENAWAFHVCNHWTAELLNAAGAPVTPALDLSTAGLAADLRWNAGAIPASEARP